MGSEEGLRAPGYVPDAHTRGGARDAVLGVAVRRLGGAGDAGTMGGWRRKMGCTAAAAAAAATAAAASAAAAAASARASARG